MSDGKRMDAPAALAEDRGPHPQSGSRLRISRVETFLVPPRWLFVRIETDSGVAGWGEPVVEGRAETVRTAVAQLSEILLGQDPLRIEDLWQVMTKGSFYRGGPILSSAVAGIDQALWDIAGKHLGVPVHQLLGGHVRDRIRMYGWVHGDEPAEIGDSVAKQLAAGMTAVKMNASGRMGPIGSPADIDGVLGRVAAAREVLGPQRDVAIDSHGRFTLANARRIAPLLEPLRPFFLEEPVVPENSHLLGELTRFTSTPIATGERLYSRQEFLPVLQAGIAGATPISPAPGASRRHARSRRSRTSSTCSSRRAARSVLSRSRRAFRWGSRPRTTSSRSRASASATAWTTAEAAGPRCWTTCSTARRSRSSTDTWCA